MAWVNVKGKRIETGVYKLSPVKRLGIHRAKKPHRCVRCGEWIEVGEPIFRLKVWEEEGWVWVESPFCERHYTPDHLAWVVRNAERVKARR